MASAEYIFAAKQTNIQPTVFMQVEDGNAATEYYTSQLQWEGSDTLTNIDTTEEPGSVTNERFGNNLLTTNTPWKFVDGDGISVTNGAAFVTPITDVYLNYFNATVIWPASLGVTLKIRVLVRDAIETPTVEYITPEQTITGLAAGIGFTDISLIGATIVTAATTRYLIVQGYDTGSSKWFNLQNISTAANTTLFDIKPTSQVITSAISFDDKLDTGPVFSIDDVTESGASIDYSYTYSDLGSVYSAGGSIVDGDTLIASKFYKIQADFSTTTGGRGKIREIQLSEGLFRFFGTHIDEPFAGVKPYLEKDSVSTLNQKITIGQGISTTGESSVKLKWVAETSDLIASGYLKGQDVQIFSGFVGLSLAQYEPVLVGTWYDHDLDETSRTITVKIRDALKQFEKRTVPEETVDNTDGSITTPVKTYTTENLITVILDIFDSIGLRDRYIHPDWATLEAGDYAVDKYKVSRTFAKPEEAFKLINQLCVTGCIFAVPLGNGQIKPKVFDINAEHTAELDATEIDFVNLKGNVKDFFSRFYAYYNPKAAFQVTPNWQDPSKSDDYDNGTAVIDATAELNWFPEKGTKQHLDLWRVGRTTATTALTVPPQALIDLNNLNHSLLTEPLYTVTAKKVPPRYAQIEVSDTIQVNNLVLPVVDEQWNGGAIYTGKSKSSSAEDSAPESVEFSTDGSKMYILGNGGNAIFEYNLLVSWDVSSATYNGVTKSVSTQDTVPLGMFITRDGTTLYMVGDGTNTVYQYGMSTPWDLSTLTFSSKSISVVAESTTSTGVSFNLSGDKMYVSDDASRAIYQYDLSTPFDVSTALYNSVTLDVSTQDTSPQDVLFNQNGSRMYVLGDTGNQVYQYDLTLSWDLSTASYSNKSFTIAEEGNPNGCRFSLDGKSMYIVGSANKTTYQYSMGIAYEIGSTTYETGDRAITGGRMWRSRVGSNTGNDPVSEAAFWQDTEILSDGRTEGKHFFVLGRKFNPNKALIELDLLEMPPGTIGAFSSAFSSAFDV